MTETSAPARAIMGPAPTAGLTRRQRETLDFICGFCVECGAAPTYAEIAAHLGLKTRQSAHRLVCRLKARGAVTCRRGQPRSLAPVLRNAITLELPPDLDRAVRVLAQRSRTTPEAVVIEAVHERLAGIVRSLAAVRRFRKGAGDRGQAPASNV
jgi:SOS-response transcriptional repressor LexA